MEVCHIVYKLRYNLKKFISKNFKSSNSQISDIYDIGTYII